MALEFEFAASFKFMKQYVVANCQIFTSCQHKINLTLLLALLFLAFLVCIFLKEKASFRAR
jgi:hypothetical protein